MTPFTYTAAPARVVFGAGSLQHLGRELERARRAPRARALDARAGGVRPARGRAARRARGRRVRPGAHARADRDGAGRPRGSTPGGGRLRGGDRRRLDHRARQGDRARGRGRRVRFPIVAIPTTYAGSEMTPIWGLTEGGVKKTGRDPRVLPRAVIYDPELTLTLPLGLTVTSALNAIAHAAEGLYAHDGNPVMSLMAEEGIRAAAAAPAAAPEGRRAISRRAATRSMARGCAARCSATSRWACTTSSATRSAAPSTCRTPRCTRWCCRTRSPTTRPRQPRRWRAWRARSPARPSRRERARAVFDLARDHGAPTALREHRHAGRATSIAPPTSRCRTRTRTRGRSNAPRSASCCNARTKVRAPTDRPTTPTEETRMTLTRRTFVQAAAALASHRGASGSPSPPTP